MITVDKAWKTNSWKTNQIEFFRSTSLQILANQSFIIFHGPHLRKKSTMRRCFYHTDLVQNAVFHDLSRLITMRNLKRRLIRLSFWVLLQAMFMNGWKQTAKRWKSHFWDYQQSIKKYHSLEHLQRQQFSFTKTNEYLSVSKNPQVFTSELKD